MGTDRDYLYALIGQLKDRVEELEQMLDIALHQIKVQSLEIRARGAATSQLREQIASEDAK